MGAKMTHVGTDQFGPIRIDLCYGAGYDGEAATPE